MKSTSEDASSPHYRHIVVLRSARYCLLGDATANCRELWIVAHGYGQLAARFVRHFAPLVDSARVIVAPEALSRFYLEHPARAGAANTRVGATWMTREDREVEIADHVRYLDAVVDEVRSMMPGASPTIHVLGFSQGVATVTRWLSRGRTRAHRVIAWAGRIPSDLLPMDDSHPLRQVELDIVSGDEDELATPEVLREQRDLVEGAGLRARWHRYAGGHRIHSETLVMLAGDARKDPPQG